jgi:membrane-associated phospholipid phosphatase
MNAPWLIASVVGAVVLAATIHQGMKPAIPEWEQRAFHSVNGLPGWLFPVMWPVMQLGNLAVGAAAGLVVAGLARRWDVAASVVLVVALKLAAEKLLRRELHGRIPARVRPGTSQTGATLRGGDIPTDGPSFPSGHALLAAGLACVVAPVASTGLMWMPFVLAFLVAFGRVYVGAHNPLDVTCGLGAGLLVGGVVAGVLA